MHLHDWEAILAPHLSKIELLSEIPLDRAGHAQLEQDLAVFVQRHGLTEATRRLRLEYPAVFVTYLAFKAAFNDEQGFWDKVKQDLGITQAQLHSDLHHWGQTFIEVIETFPNLRRFRGVSGHEYITPIRLHGGIPAYSLPDFFQHILLPSTEKAPYDGMDDESALKALLEHYTAQLFVDDVVRHFFRHAGEAARKFFSKCRHMARLAQTNQPLPEPAELGLRPYVVQSFATYQHNQAAPSQRRRRPRLYFDPYLPAFRILLPPQPLNLEQAGQRYDARLYAPVTGEIYAQQSRLRPHRQGQEWFIDEIEWLLEEPLPAIQAGLFAAGQEAPLYAYPLRLLPPAGYPPLLAFRYEDTRQISLSLALPATILWLFYPANIELRFDGEARPVQTLHPFALPWEGWQAAAWDLSETRLLRLLRDGQDFCPPISISRALEPSLTPSSLPLHVLAVDDKPLYNVAPQIHLPLRTPETPHDELKDWLVHLESRYAAAPQGDWKANADELPYTIENAEAWISLATWLGESPAGTYHLTLRHRDRPISELPFRVCTRLEINGLQPYYLPTLGGAQPVTFQVHLSPECRLVSENDIVINSSPVNGNVFGVKIPPQISQADLRLELPAKPEVIRIPLRVSIPRLRWALALEKGTALEWAHQPIARSLAELLQTDLARSRPRLRVELPLMEGQKPLTALHLTAPGHETSLQISESRSLAGQWLEFDISAFFDTLRAHPEESVFELSLELLDVERELNLCLPVLRLARELDIRVCRFESTLQGGWHLHWYEPRPLRHRRLRLWSRWQPWSNPLEIPLPDDAPTSDTTPGEGWWMYNIPEEFGLPPSNYRAQFVAVSPYEHNSPPPFPPEHAIEIQMVTSQSRLWHIENELPSASPARAFALHFEKLCIHHTENNTGAMQQEIRWSLSHWREASLSHLETLARWLGEYNFPEDQLAFLMQMFREEILKQLEEERYPPEFVQKYLGNIANLRTIRPESIRRVLNLARDPVVILYALKSLLKSDAKEAHHTFWEALAEGRFSETDAAALLEDSPDFARHLLKDTPASPLRSRLLRELGHYLDLPEYLVKIGYYVLCDAGWGKLLEIRGAERENLFFPSQETPVLLLELLHWPGQKVEIDLGLRQVNLIDRKGVNRCGCGRFAALGGEQTRATWQEHRAFCRQTTASPLPASFSLNSHPIYRASAPENPLDTRSGV